MTHLDEGRLQAYLDGELSPDGRTRVDDHLDGCRECADRLSGLRSRAETVARAVGRLEATSGTEAARDEVVRRARRGAGWSPRVLARAAGVVLLLAAASAVPGSPVRGWLAAGWARVTALVEGEASAGSSPAVAEEAAPAGDAAPPAGVRLSPESGRIRILLVDVAPGAELAVSLVDGEKGGVFAPEGSRFRTGGGVVEARVGPGPVRVELPRGAEAAILEVNGDVYLRLSRGSLELPGPVRDSVAPVIRFRVEPREPGGGG